MKCHECNEIIDNENFKTCDGDYLCENCLDNYHECYECGNYCKLDEMIDVFGDYHSNYYCQECTDNYSTRCDSCGEHFLSVESIDGYDYCTSCFNDRYLYCGICCSYVECDLIDYCDDCGTPHCDNCRCCSNHDEIHNYSYKPRPKIKGTVTKQNPSIGFELEIELEGAYIDDAVETALDLDNVYLKRDESLDYGFEIVTHPATIDKHFEMFNNYNNVLKHLIRLGVRSHDTSTCGLHFHVAKKYLTDSAKDNIMYFFSEHQTIIEKIARRKSCGYANYLKVNKRKDASKVERYSRYGVDVNPKTTIEFRVFRGTLNTETLMASMEFCYLVYRYCIKRNISEKQLSDWNKFIQFAKSLKPKYFIKYYNNRCETIVNDNIDIAA